MKFQQIILNIDTIPYRLSTTEMIKRMYMGTVGARRQLLMKWVRSLEHARIEITGD